MSLHQPLGDKAGNSHGPVVLWPGGMAGKSTCSGTWKYLSSTAAKFQFHNFNHDSQICT